MNQYPLRLKFLKDKILDAEIQLGMIENDLDAIEKDILYLGKMKDMLAENLAILKEDGIVVVASEYGKVILELETVEENLIFYKSLHNRLLNKFDKHRQDRDEAIKEHDELKDKIDNRKIILNFDPNKRKK